MRILLAAAMIGAAAQVAPLSVSAAIEIMAAAVITAMLSSTRIGK